MSDLPGVSMICPTCGRCPSHQHLLEECVESFVRQDYAGPKELLILNDCPKQDLVCTVPGVRIVNVKDRYSSLGSKYNAMLQMAEYEIICPAEDDDISLPWRLSLSVTKLGDMEYFNPKAYFFLNGEHIQFEQNTGYAHNASIFRASAARRAGGYPDNCRQDASMHLKLNYSSKMVDNKALSKKECFYIYCWSRGPHLSGNSDPEKAWREYGKQKFQEGVFEIKPRWVRDYISLAKTAKERQLCQ